MPVCVKGVGINPALAPVNPVKDANGNIVGGPVGTDYAKCDLVVLTGTDYQQMAGGLYLSAADGAVASGLIVSCWVAAYAARSVIAVFRGSSKDE